MEANQNYQGALGQDFFKWFRGLAALLLILFQTPLANTVACFLEAPSLCAFSEPQGHIQAPYLMWMLGPCCLNLRHIWTARGQEKYSDSVLPSSLGIKPAVLLHCVPLLTLSASNGALCDWQTWGVWQRNEKTKCFTISSLHKLSENTSWQQFNF